MKRCSRFFISHSQNRQVEALLGIGAWNLNPLTSLVKEVQYDLAFLSLDCSAMAGSSIKFIMIGFARVNLVKTMRCPHRLKCRRERIRQVQHSSVTTA